MVFRAIDPQASDSAMAPPEERQCSDSAMTTTEMFAMILAKLEETNAQLHTLVEPSPSSTSNERKTEVANSTTSTAAPPAAQDVSLVVPVANSDYSEREIDITIGAGFSFQCSDSPRSARVAASENAATTISKPATSSSASSMSSLTFAPSLEVPPVIPSATTDHIWDTPPRCSTFCQDQDTGNWKAVHSSSASPTSSPTSSPPRGNDSAVLIASSDQVVATHSRCSTPGLYQMVGVRVPASPFLAISVASTDTMLPQEVVQTIPATAIDHVQTARILESASSPLYNTCGQVLDISISASSKAMVLWCPDASTSAANKLFNEMPLFLFLPPATCSFENSHSVPELGSMAWPPGGTFLKQPWPPPAQLVSGNGMLLRPAPWPSINQDYAKIQIAAVNRMWMVWYFYSERCSLGYLLACFGAQFGKHMLQSLLELLDSANRLSLDYKEQCLYVLFARGEDYSEMQYTMIWPSIVEALCHEMYEVCILPRFLIKVVAATAWGQAVFQGGKDGSMNSGAERGLWILAALRIYGYLITHTDAYLSVWSYDEFMLAKGSEVQFVSMHCFMKEVTDEGYILVDDAIRKDSGVADMSLLKPQLLLQYTHNDLPSISKEVVLLEATQLMMSLAICDHWSSWVLARCLNFDKDRTCFLDEAKQKLQRHDREAKPQVFKLYMSFKIVWCGGRVTFNIKDLQVPWDPGGFEYVLDISITAWGQAVFQGGKYVRDLSLLGYESANGPQCWTCLGPRKHRRGNSIHIYQQVERKRASKDQNHEPAAAASASLSRGERLLEASLG